MMTMLVKVDNHFCAQSEADVQFIMQNLTDAMDGTVIANTDMLMLSGMTESLVEQDAVRCVTLSRDDSCGYTLTVRYRAGVGARTVITVSWMNEDAGASMIEDIQKSLLAAGLVEIIAFRGVAGKEAVYGGD